MIEGAEEFVRRFRDYLPGYSRNPQVKEAIGVILDEMRHEQQKTSQKETLPGITSEETCPFCFGHGMQHKPCPNCGKQAETISSEFTGKDRQAGIASDLAEDDELGEAK